MKETERKWRTSPVLKSGATITIQFGIGSCNWGIGEFSKVLPNNPHDSQVEATHIANARLIVSAVNACKAINPENPMVVAESIKDMHEALSFFIDRNASEYVFLDRGIGISTEIGQKFLTARKALAKADSKEEK